MSVVIAREDVGPCQKRLTIEVPAEAVTAEIGRVVGDYRKRLDLPGFRKGKVPVQLVRRRFRDQIEHEVTERLVPRYWRQAQAEEGLDPLLPPRFDDLKIEDGEPMTLVASVETRPEIELGELGDFQLPEGTTEPTDEEVEAALADIRQQHATWSPVDRAAGRGDLVVARLEDRSGDKPDRKIHAELGGDGIDEELTLALTGLTAGQGTDYDGALQPGAEAERVKIEVSEVREQEVPELDLELARRLGDFETIDDFRRAVVEGVERSKESELRGRREKALLEQLRQRHPLDLPAGVVQQESEEMLQRYGHRLAGQGVDLEQADIDWEALMAQVRPEAERRVHDRLLLDAVAKAEGLRLDESEFERFLAGMASQNRISTLEVRRQLADNGRLEGLRMDLLRAQAVRRLLGEEESADPGQGDDGADGDSADRDSARPDSARPDSARPETARPETEEA